MTRAKELLMICTVTMHASIYLKHRITAETLTGASSIMAPRQRHHATDAVGSAFWTTRVLCELFSSARSL